MKILFCIKAMNNPGGGAERCGQRGRHVASSGWLIAERPPPGHAGERKQYFAWGLDDLDLEALIELVHVRGVIERFYQDAKGQLGLDDYEGSLWPGLHRHLAQVMLAHCFLTLQQSYGPSLLEPNASAPARGSPPPEGRKSVAALRRSVLEELFRQVIAFYLKSRDGPEIT